MGTLEAEIEELQEASAQRAGNTPQVILDTYAHHMPSADAKADEAIERWVQEKAA